MTKQPEALAEMYVTLALALDQHIDGYIDSYHAPAEWRTAAQAAGKQPLPELARWAHELGIALNADRTMPAERRHFLQCQLRAMQTSIALLQGETLTLTQETEALYDVTPRWTDDAQIVAAHHALDELLPSGGTLLERMLARRTRLKMPFERIAPLIPPLLADMRARTQAKFPLPEGESFEFAPVKDKPWGAYNWYLGNYHSLIEWNTDLPSQLNMMPATLAHEGYPGHHTEHCIKDHDLVHGRGWMEYAVTLINAPECVIAEGIATTALDIIYSKAEQIELNQNTIYPALGLDLDAAREQEIDRALEQLGGVRTNASFLLHDQKESAETVAKYLQDFALMEPANAQKAIQFQSHPLYRSYIFTYSMGEELLRELFAARGNAEMWFGRLLTEPITPQVVRGWIGGGN